ncbi:Copia protein [Cucumis melo var. makuwa]|uniref:Copia protein n=1 Tax=Cucumis melo var. makuwa TaxID=1194695 RepID=A0A5A7U8N9_CUCMM|nr:Copia protein [Cucumis melo var. makuwa]TYK08672.1 Copia protein [Cucumis melo var. makuwa]
MISERDKDENLDTNIDGTQIETVVGINAVVAAEKLLASFKRRQLALRAQPSSHALLFVVEKLRRLELRPSRGRVRPRLGSWRSKKRSVVTKSNAEAEDRAMSLGICKEIWLKKALYDLHQGCETPLMLFCDNKAAITIANNSVQHDRTKHVEIDRHFIKERLDNGSICIPYIASSQQIVDVLTKGLLKPNFTFVLASWASLIFTSQMGN